MLEQLFPRSHRRYSASPHANELIRFANWLDDVGYGHDPAHDHVRRLRESLDCRDRQLGSYVDRSGVAELFSRRPDAVLNRPVRSDGELNILAIHCCATVAVDVMATPVPG